VATGEARAAMQATAAGRSRLARYVRPALAGLLVLAVCVGTRALAPTANPYGGPLHRYGMLTGAAIEALLAALLVALGLVGRYSRQRGHPVPMLRLLLGRTIAIAMIVLAVLMGINAVGLRPRGKMLDIFRGEHPSRPGKRLFKPEPSAGPAHLVDLLYVALLVVLIAAVVACILLIRRRAPAGPAGYLDDYPAADTSLREAVESGHAALRQVDDARAAIIACYLAMEASLAKAGTARTVAETPDELLARAAASGLVRGTSAGRLTEMFYEARFSTHALPQAARAEASQLLDLIAADLSSLAELP